MSTNGELPLVNEVAGSAIPEVDILIIGAGPAGASLACFLASYGEFKGKDIQHLSLIHI